MFVTEPASGDAAAGSDDEMLDGENRLTHAAQRTNIGASRARPLARHLEQERSVEPLVVLGVGKGARVVVLYELLC
jgi:hypothetical protein